MSKKKRLSVKEIKQQFPEVFQDANGHVDKRIDEEMERLIAHMINEGESPYDAKLKTLCIAMRPDHFKQVSPAGAWPKLLYHEDGKQTKLVEDDEELADAIKQKCWSAKLTQKHLDRLQRGTAPRDENIKRLQRELDSELKKKAEEQETVTA